jgi:hypothetical protein
MPGDYTRVTFDALKDRIGVLMQQGRVLLDADFNEFVEIIERRVRAGDLDTFSRCVVPRVTPNGFRIQIGAGNMLTIGPGRIYVDGMLAENHGAPPLEFDRRLEEVRGTNPLPYDEQPYLPDAATLFPVPPEGGPHLVYLDVWQRELTHAEDPDVVEKAVGVDTCARLQTVWQVKVLPDVGQGVTCATPDGQIEAWQQATAPSAGRLTTSAVGIPADTDPCTVDPAGGFRGTENRLYRVEVHDGGAMGTASFKWSRDNGSIATPVTGINAGGDRLEVVRTARDAVLRFSPDDWVEVLDDRLELAGLPGIMRRVAEVDDVAGTLELADPLPAGSVDFADPAALHTRVRRWDQRGQVLDEANAVVADVDASGGVIPITAPGRFVLEHGVLVELSLAPAGGTFRTGDYWVFAARTVDASVEELEQAPPKGIHHHYCRLAIVTFPNPPMDCRVLWPPELEARGCGCTECVTAESHNSGAFTIQAAIDRVRATGGTVCLGPGAYNLGTQPVLIAGAQTVRLVGHGLRTTLFYLAMSQEEQGTNAAIRVAGSVNVDIERLAVVSIGTRDRGGPALLVQSSALVDVHKCAFVQIGATGVDGAAVTLAGAAIEVVLRDNLLWGATGVSARTIRTADTTTGLAQQPSFLATFGLRIEDNLVAGVQRGIDLDGLLLHLGDVRIAGNTVVAGPLGGVVTGGLGLPTSRTDVVGNLVIGSGNGVVVGSDGARVAENDISSLSNQAPEAEPFAAGVLIARTAFSGDIARCRVSNNRVLRIPGDGIAIRTNVESASIDGNWIEGVAENGIVVLGEAEVGLLTVANNHVVNASRSNTRLRGVAGIRVLRGGQVDIAGNVVRGFALEAVQSPSRSGIEVVASRSVRVNGNDLQGIGPEGDFVGAGAGISIVGPFERVDVADNTVRRSAAAIQAAGNAGWYALRISPPLILTIGQVVLVAASALGRTARSAAASIRVADFTEEAVAVADVSSDSYALITAVRPELASDFVLVAVNQIIVLPRGREIVAVRGNLLEARGTRAAAVVTNNGPTVFSDNRCLLTPSPNSNAPTVDIDAAAAIASANYLERPAAPTGAAAERALDIQVGNGPVTILGNIAAGSIILNGNPLPAGSPWAPLNVQV